MLVKVQKNLEKFNILPVTDQKQVLIAAVSGGADSVCLLLILSELKSRLGFELEVIHVEHGIRGEESQKDAVFVENLCKMLSVKCHMVHVDVPAFCRQQGIGEEEAARILRYQAFREYALLRNGKIVLAHHMEDNAETVLFQMLRGSSLTGMCGISPLREDEQGVVYLRPLLDIRRSEIEAYLETVGQSYCTDSTNLETEYHRNYIRKDIIPRLTEINSAAVPHISQTAARLGEVRDFLKEETQKAIARLVRREEKMILDIVGFAELHPALQKEVVYELISKIAGSKKDITSTHVEEVLSLLSSQSGKQVALPYRVVVRRSFDTIVFEKKTEDANRKTIQDGSDEEKGLRISEEILENWKANGLPVSLPLSEKGEQFVVKIFSYSGNEEEIPKKPYTKWFDYDKIKRGFCIRNRENGDFLINDMEGHRKKLKSYFIDEKIPLEQRGTMWLLAQDSLVLWVVGGRISEHIKVDRDTKTVMEVHYIGGN